MQVSASGLQGDYSAHRKVFMLFALLLSAVFSYAIKFGTLQLSANYLYLLGITSIVALLFPTRMDNDGFENKLIWFGREVVVCVVNLAPILGILLLTGFIFKVTAIFSREWTFYWLSLAIVIYILTIYLYFMADELGLRKRKNRNRVLLVGSGNVARHLAARSPDWLGHEIAGYLDNGNAGIKQPVAGLEYLGNCSDLNKVLDSHSITEVWITLQPGASEQIDAIIDGSQLLPVTVRYFPNINIENFLNYSASLVEGLPAVTLNDTPLKGSNRIIKLAEDYLFTLVILAITWPIFVCIAIVIKLTSPGPILYKQKRHGWDGRIIKVYKFRTMYVDAGTDMKQATRDDRRVTRVGKYLRMTSLDELPQFINVLQGRMSVVGPRPHAVQHNEEYHPLIDNYLLRHKVKPGITGWAQVNGCRGETQTIDKMTRRIEHDLYYIRHWSVWLDMKIILLTVLKGFVHKNAY